MGLMDTANDQQMSMLQLDARQACCIQFQHPSPLVSNNLSEASVMVGFAALVTEKSNQ